MKKDFDCVEMKNEIQRKLRAEYAGLSDEERLARIEKKMRDNPLLGSVYFRSLTDQKTDRVMEESSEYGTRKIRKKVFVDTSVFGGCFDKEFEKESRWFFDEVAAGRFEVVVSKIVMDEIDDAPEHVQRFVDGLNFRVLDPNDEVTRLRDAYIDEGILGKSSLDDAEHIAAASIEAVDLMVSWNFKHIVHFDKIRAYNAINVLRGYRGIDIRCPSEVISYDD